MGMNLGVAPCMKTMMVGEGREQMQVCRDIHV